jgi:hypothetical protein
LNVHGVNEVRKTEIHASESLVRESGYFKVEIAIEKLKRYESPSVDQIPAVLIQAAGKT